MVTRLSLAVWGAPIAALAAVSIAAATTGGKNGLIVYAQEQGPEHFQLFTIRPDGTGAKQVTHGASSFVHPDWSADGKRIVVGVERKDRAGIAIMAADGSGLRILTPTGLQGEPAFSPDGKWIVYERDVSSTDNGIWIIRTDGSSNHRLTKNPYMTSVECGCDTDPNFSPSGKLISFVRVKRNEAEQALFVMAADGSGLHQLTPFSWEVAVKHDWSPDGKLILLTTNADLVRPGEAANLVTIHPDGSGRRQLTHYKAGKMNGYAGSFSPDGKQIVFRLEDGLKSGLAVVGRNGGKATSLTSGSTAPRSIDWGTHP